MLPKATILGREPAMWVNLIGTLVALFTAFVIHLSVDQQGAVNGIAAAIVGIIVWRSTSDGLSALILGLLKAAVAVALAWHFNVSAENQAIIYLAAAAVLAMFVRTQATPGKPVIEGELASRAVGYRR